MKNIDMDLFLVFVSIISIVIAYFMVNTTEHRKIIDINQCKIIFEKLEGK